MKVLLPDETKDVTLKQYQEHEILKKRKDLNEYEFNQRKIRIFTGLPYRTVEKMDATDYEEFLDWIDKALERPSAFQQTFKMEGTEFGMIPNFDEIQSKEYFDLMKYKIKTETLHNLMAILFRPILNKVPNNGYLIQDYNGTEAYAEVMRYTPLNIVNGAVVFFWNLANELLECTPKSIQRERVKDRLQKNISQNGGGMRQSTEWLKGSTQTMSILKN